ncbi:MAG: hypothetical protein QXW37_08470 [Candidatus Nitrosotenuis sp.]
MVNATLWYKINASESLGQVPATQKIEFNDDDAVLQEYVFPWSNNIKQKAIVNQGQERRLALEDTGLQSLVISIRGYISTSQTTKVNNLFDFMKIQQVTDNLPFGRMSIYMPNFPNLTIEADANEGLAIGPQSVIKPNFAAKSYDFILFLYYGGKFG